MDSIRLLITFVTILMGGICLTIFPAKHMAELRRYDIEFLESAEAARIGEQVLAYQRVTGGWPKNIDMCRPHTTTEIQEVLLQHERRNGYSWYNSYPAELYSIYDRWAEQYDPSGKVKIDPCN